MTRALKFLIFIALTVMACVATPPIPSDAGVRDAGFDCASCPPHLKCSNMQTFCTQQCVFCTNTDTCGDGGYCQMSNTPDHGSCAYAVPSCGSGPVPETLAVTFVNSACMFRGDFVFFCRWSHRVSDAGVAHFFEHDSEDGGLVTVVLGTREFTNIEKDLWRGAADNGLWCFERPVFQEECGSHLGAFDFTATAPGRESAFRVSGADSLIPSLAVMNALDLTLANSRAVWRDAGIPFQP